MFLNPKRLVKRMGLSDGMRVADFGSGSGHFTLAIAPLVGKLGRVYAVDIHTDLLTRLKNEATALGHENVDVVRANMEDGSLPFPMNYLDAAVLSNTMFQLSDKELALRSLRKFMKPAGMLLMSDWAGSFNHMGPHPSYVFSEAEARRMLEHAGFVVRSVVPAGLYHWALIAEKRVTDI
jgi:ubiquinone/menaquinone biosynthesis C-methylase UbiE